MAYRVHDVKISKADREKADTILLKHWHSGDIDTVECNETNYSDGTIAVTYRIRPYIYEDLEAIKNEFQREGIQLL